MPLGKNARTLQIFSGNFGAQVVLLRKFSLNWVVRPEASASTASWMIRPCISVDHLVLCNLTELDVKMTAYNGM